MPTTHAPHGRPQRAFALPELFAIFALFAILTALLLVAQEKTRRTARLGDDLAKFRFIAAATGSYAADNENHVWSLSWQGGVDYGTKHGDLNTAFADSEAAANQAVYILRTRAGRNDIPRISSWIPYVMYNHLALVDYLDAPLPDSTFISSADKHRQDWANDTACFDQGCFGIHQPPPSAENRRWPYSASFLLPPAFWDRSIEPNNRVAQGSTHSTYMIPTNADLGPTLTSDIAFPSQKVFLYDQFARHFGQRVPFATHPEARLPLLFADGSAHVKAASESNLGWRPNAPQMHTAHTQFTYHQDAWTYPLPPGTSNIMRGHFIWTRAGIAGRDFGGAEIRVY